MSWSSSSPRGCSPDLHHSNLESFLHTVTPILPRRSFPQSDVNDNGAFDYFYLSDLWESYYEWSAYGVGSPIVLSNGERILQYYAPYLSALQLFTAKSPSPAPSNVNNYDVELEAESLCDDMESDKSSRQSSDSSKTWDVDSGDSNTDHHQVSMSRKDCCADLYFEFYDTCPPYLRVPLTEKVLGFSQKQPEIMSFKSTDLSPASWMAISWYPIYHIPFKQTIKDLSACFLTFHTLSSSFQEILKVNEDEKVKGQCSSKMSGHDKIALPPFALATHKLHGEVWTNPFTADEERFYDLHCAADSWLKQLNVQHHDFSFFAHHSNNRIINGWGMSMYN